MTLKYSANIGFLWDDLPLPERILAAGKAGFDAVECHFPYDYSTEEINTAVQEAGLPMIGLNTALGPEGAFGLAAIAGQEDAAREIIDQAISYASQLNANHINVVAGLTQGDPTATPVYVNNLRYACDEAAKVNKTIVIEPLNPRAVPSYHFSTVEEACAIIDTAGKDNLKIMFDFFHAQIVQGDLETLLKDYIGYIGHIQLSAVHDRGEPDSGEINYRYLMEVLDRLGYRGYIGAEYKPRQGSVEAGLGWLSQFRNHMH